MLDVVILCGGLGSRLKSAVSDRPKAMAEIGYKPFLDLQIDYFLSWGYRRFILCTGYMGDYISRYYQNGNDCRKDCEIILSHENEPLGTAGAIKHAESHICGDHFLVVNGDTFCPVDLTAFHDAYTGNKAFIAMVLTGAGDTNGFGLVLLDEYNRIVSFSEKAAVSRRTYVNAGIYLFSTGVMDLIPRDTRYSVEYDLFPGILASGTSKTQDRSLYGYITAEGFLDIGTPERYEKAKRILVKSANHRMKIAQ